MMSIVPSVIAPSPRRAGRMEFQHAGLRGKHIPAGASSRSNPESLFGLQLQRSRIDAVAQSGWARAILKDMAEVTVALRAEHFGADHAMADVALFVDVVLRSRRRKARPAAAGVEFGVGLEQRLPAARADIGARSLLVLVFAGERALGRLLAQHRVLHRRQFFAPLGLALYDFVSHRLGLGHRASSHLVFSRRSVFNRTAGV